MNRLYVNLYALVCADLAVLSRGRVDVLRVQHFGTVEVLQHVHNAAAIPVIRHAATVVYLPGCVLQNLDTEGEKV